MCARAPARARGARGQLGTELCSNVRTVGVGLMSCSMTSVTPQDRLGGDGVRQTGRRGDKEPRAGLRSGAEGSWDCGGLQKKKKKNPAKQNKTKKTSLKEVALN